MKAKPQKIHSGEREDLPPPLMRIESSLVRAFSPGKNNTIDLDENEENILMLLIATFEAVRFKCDIKKTTTMNRNNSYLTAKYPFFIQF